MIVHSKSKKYPFFHAFQTNGRKIVYTCIHNMHHIDQVSSTMAALPVSHGRLLPFRWIKLFGSNDRIVSYYYRTAIQVLRQSVSDMRMFYKTVSVFPLENLRKHFMNRAPGLSDVVYQRLIFRLHSIYRIRNESTFKAIRSECRRSTFSIFVFVFVDSFVPKTYGWCVIARVYYSMFTSKKSKNLEHKKNYKVLISQRLSNSMFIKLLNTQYTFLRVV